MNHPPLLLKMAPKGEPNRRVKLSNPRGDTGKISNNIYIYIFHDIFLLASLVDRDPAISPLFYFNSKRAPSANVWSNETTLHLTQHKLKKTTIHNIQQNAKIFENFYMRKFIRYTAKRKIEEKGTTFSKYGKLCAKF